MTPLSSSAVLDDPVGESLRHHHAHLARTAGRTATYLDGVATFSALPRDPAPQDWSDLASLLGPGGFADVFSAAVTPPAHWQHVFTTPGLQLIADGSRLAPAEPAVKAVAEVVELGAGDVPEMLELTALTRPGPFWEQTHRMGRYVGVRAAGRLVAMAGERLRPPGWTEISAVCTAPEARGKGYAARLVRELADGILARGERPFLHVAAENVAAAELYRRLGFEVRCEVVFHGYRTP